MKTVTMPTPVNWSQTDDTYFAKDSLKWYFDNVKYEQPLTFQEEKDLINKAQKGNLKARDKIVKSQQRLVIKIALKYKAFPIPVMDLIAEGNIGLMYALTKFKPALGFRFSTYAAWWIRSAIGHCISTQYRLIHLPDTVTNMYHKYKKMIYAGRNNPGGVPTIEQLAKKLGTTPLHLDVILNIIQVPGSLTDVLGDEDNEWTLSDLIEDKNTIKPDEYFFKKAETERLLDLISNLTVREVMIITAHYGLNNTEPLSLREIAKKIHLSHEMVRRIETAAIKKLKELLMVTDN